MNSDTQTESRAFIVCLLDEVGEMVNSGLL